MRARDQLWRAFVPFALLLGMFIAVSQSTAWNTEAAAQEDIGAIARALFGTYIVPFLVLSLLLTGALLGALYMGMHSQADDQEEAAGR